jgi:predicted O-methyltransferase YrrM
MTTEQYPNWFMHGAVNLFSKYLEELKGKEIHCLQIGAYTGDATEWLLENILTHPNSTLTDVDTWEGSDESIHKEFDWKDVETVYTERHQKHIDSGRLIKKKMTSNSFFEENTNMYDFVYIDGDHTAIATLKDGINGIASLKLGGIVAFDDYTWESGKGPANNPKPGIDGILLSYAQKLFTLEISFQVWLRKIS